MGIKHKKRILVDLDGVLNDYNGDYNTAIPPIKKGAKAFVKKLSKKYELYLFTSRNLLLSAKWLIENDIDSCFCDITNTKLPSHIYIDDRAINFNGSYKTTLDEIDKFHAYWEN